MGLAGAPIGLLGGSFDPIHYGHLQLARDALKQLPLEEVRFIPAAQPWQKGPITAAEHRARMVQMAIGGEPRFALDMREIERGGITYTIDTVHALRSQLPDCPLVLIMGSDQFARFDTWRSWQEIVETAHIAVAQRAGTSLQRSPDLQAVAAARRGEGASLTTRAAGSIVEFAMTPIDVSATEVRHLLREPPSTERAQRAGTSLQRSPDLQAVAAARRDEGASLTTRAAGSIVEFAMTPIDVSATEVRHLLREPRSTERAQRLSAMVPAVVLDYIDSNHLYRA